MSTLDQQIKSLRSETSTDDFVRLIDLLKVTDQKFNVLLLVNLLSERHIIYKDRSSLSSQRMRAYLIEAFHHIGLPQRDCHISWKNSKPLSIPTSLQPQHVLSEG
jgi:protein SCO1/2